ncbi:MAG TPA: DNA-binding transcriptional regulator [Kiritimatiellia bacterium]|nr:DNA-binding transcriptional regulator [Kiritimatiellia bacterium]HPS06105.1 DNA-binding transcriptional regulator [Kiritimatiellia bacterium]
MPRFLQKIPHVLVILPTVQKACRDKLQGILKYARIHGPWDVQTLEDHPYIARLGGFKNWKPDGVINGDEDSKVDFLSRARRLPVVMLDPLSAPAKKRSSLRHDSRLIAEAVAGHFLQAGLKNFGFVGCVPSSAWSQTRARAFSERLKQAGFPCHLYEARNAEDWGLEQGHMSQWLLALPKPCGIMVAVDLRAKQVLDTCLAAGVRVPEEVAVVGVDNDETLCENTTPTLSSVLPDFEGGGYLSAELLDRLMRGTQKKPTQLTYGIKEIVQRQSSQYIPHANRLIASAVEFIRLNACAGITVMDIVQSMNVSRRFAERHFREARGHSILDEIQHVRLERVCALLRETNLPIRDIGERCGYETEIYLKVLFKKRFGMTMREYRNRL